MAPVRAGEGSAGSGALYTGVKLFFKYLHIVIYLFYICFNKQSKQSHMKNVKLKTIERQIRDGKVECMMDLRIGYVEIRNCITGKRYFVNVIK